MKYGLFLGSAGSRGRPRLLSGALESKEQLLSLSNGMSKHLLIHIAILGNLEKRRKANIPFLQKEWNRGIAVQRHTDHHMVVVVRESIGLANRERWTVEGRYHRLEKRGHGVGRWLFLLCYYIVILRMMVEGCYSCLHCLDDSVIKGVHILEIVAVVIGRPFHGVAFDVRLQDDF